METQKRVPKMKQDVGVMQNFESIWIFYQGIGMLRYLSLITIMIC